MPSVEGKHDGRQIILPVVVLASDDPLDLTHVRATALLDTGATSSGIGPQIIKGLELLSHEKRRLSVATELRMVDYYLFRIGIPQESSGPALPFVFAETDGFAWPEPKSFDVILGMDVLSQCDLQLSRSGRWRLDFG